jgi:hypothetical protein
MKINVCLIILISILFFSCSKYGPQQNAGATTAINLRLNKNIFLDNGTDKIIFTVKDNNYNDITAYCDFYNGTEKLSAAFFTSTQTGNEVFTAQYKNLTSNNAYASAVAKIPLYTRKVFAEDITGNWCGNCPLLSYNLDSLSKIYNSLFYTGVHDEGGDPFITTYALTIENSIPNFDGAFPTGFVNRSEKATQFSILDVVNNSLAQPAGAGLAIQTNLSGNLLSVNVTAGFEEDFSASNIKLAIMLAEDSLIASQTTYYYHSYLIPSSNPLYNEASPIANYINNNVLRSYATDPLGDEVPSAETVAGNTSYQKAVTFDLSNFNAAHCYVIAVLLQNNGTQNMVLNAQKVKAGATQLFD